jgi:hypothetical protein
MAHFHDSLGGGESNRFGQPFSASNIHFRIRPDIPLESSFNGDSFGISHVYIVPISNFDMDLYLNTPPVGEGGVEPPPYQLLRSLWSPLARRECFRGGNGTTHSAADRNKG